MTIQIMGNGKIKFVRIIIGQSETGKSGIQAPTKSIRVSGSSVQEVHKKIVEMLKNIK